MNSTTKSLFTWLSVSAAIIIVLLLMIFRGGSNGGGTTLVDEVGTDEWVKGNPEATITLVEYSDFQCPACSSYEPIVNDLVDEFQNYIRFVYRELPLRSIHANAQLAAQAAESAGIQGKFWEMHDLLFENQSDWSHLSSAEAQTTFEGYAKDLELNTPQFSDDLVSNEVEKAVNADYNGAASAGIQSTPTFFLNGEKINNPRSFEEFRSLIRDTIEQNS